jgi:beta-phosphoglucomutase-like phosphatase (HAD superfamily)
MKKDRAVIFDMDGVVIDTTGFGADAERECLGVLASMPTW